MKLVILTHVLVQMREAMAQLAQAETVVDLQTETVQVDDDIAKQKLCEVINGLSTLELERFALFLRDNVPPR